MLEQFNNVCNRLNTQRDQAKNLYTKKVNEITTMLENPSIPDEIKLIEKYRQHCI